MYLRKLLIGLILLIQLRLREMILGILKETGEPHSTSLEYVTDVKSNDQVSINIDYCYRMCNAPQTFKEAMSSPKAEIWAKAMNEEMDSLRENNTFTLTTLPEGKQEVGGRWVYAIKTNADQSETYKARYVAKRYNQVMGIDYKETFSPTANLTSIRVLMQMAAQYGLDLHQMDVKTAKSDTGENLVCRLNKSLYGLKQSGRNWNKMLSDYLTENDFVQNPADHCVYTKQIGKERAIVVIWVDDLVIAASNDDLLSDVKKTLAVKFKMKDLGKLKHFLGIEFDQNDGIVKMSQKRWYWKDLACQIVSLGQPHVNRKWSTTVMLTLLMLKLTVRW